jgi:hypothetical protein
MVEFILCLLGIGFLDPGSPHQLLLRPRLLTTPVNSIKQLASDLGGSEMLRPLENAFLVIARQVDD